MSILTTLSLEVSGTAYAIPAPLQFRIGMIGLHRRDARLCDCNPWAVVGEVVLITVYSVHGFKSYTLVVERENGIT